MTAIAVLSVLADIARAESALFFILLVAIIVAVIYGFVLIARGAWQAGCILIGVAVVVGLLLL